MNRLIQYIESNLERFSNMEEDEVIELDAHYMDDDIVEYLKGTNQYMYKDVCMYYVGESDEVWIEKINIP